MKSWLISPARGERYLAARRLGLGRPSCVHDCRGGCHITFQLIRTRCSQIQFPLYPRPAHPQCTYTDLGNDMLDAPRVRCRVIGLWKMASRGLKTVARGAVSLRSR